MREHIELVDQVGRVRHAARHVGQVNGEQAVVLLAQEVAPEVGRVQRRQPPRQCRHAPHERVVHRHLARVHAAHQIRECGHAAVQHLDGTAHAIEVLRELRGGGLTRGADLGGLVHSNTLRLLRLDRVRALDQRRDGLAPARPHAHLRLIQLDGQRALAGVHGGVQQQEDWRLVQRLEDTCVQPLVALARCRATRRVPAHHLEVLEDVLVLPRPLLHEGLLDRHARAALARRVLELERVAHFHCTARLLAQQQPDCTPARIGAGAHVDARLVVRHIAQHQRVQQVRRAA
mmetsp:Transcript_11532/g.35641  ORF Transcript_11532/g.35641 Transcript_11532/m.35641 type:complete len:289 (+) Transcript_11532:288-1154(+)